MDDAEFITDRIAAIEESISYYSSENKSERERWVAGTFLENLNIAHDSSEVRTPENDPPDVVALGAEFEVKEILDPGRRRHLEYKEELKRAKTLRTAQELLTEFRPVDSSIQEIFQLCCTATEDLAKKYPPSVRSSLDLLFYVNLQHVMEVHETPYPDVSKLRSSGWRSVSFVKWKIASCFYATEESPSWLRGRAGQVCHKVFE